MGKRILQTLLFLGLAGLVWAILHAIAGAVIDPAAFAKYLADQTWYKVPLIRT